MVFCVCPPGWDAAVLARWGRAGQQAAALHHSLHLPIDTDRCGLRTLSKIMKRHTDLEWTQLHMSTKKTRGRTRGPREVPAK